MEKKYVAIGGTCMQVTNANSRQQFNEFQSVFDLVILMSTDGDL